MHAIGFYPGFFFSRVVGHRPARPGHRRGVGLKLKHVIPQARVDRPIVHGRQGKGKPEDHPHASVKITPDPSNRYYRIFFPNADWISSTANSAEALHSSKMGLASTTSSDVMMPLSAITSMMRCASR
jgi:hypothetical protein